MDAISRMLICIFPVLVHASIEDSQGQPITSENERTLYYSSIPYAIARQGHRSLELKGTVIGFSEAEDRVFSISEKMRLVSTRKEGRIVLNSWQLAFTPYTHNSQLVSSQYRSIDSFFNIQLDQERIISGVGCQGETPLRYGDVDGDDEPEIILTTGRAIVVFSLLYKKVVFSEYIRVVDEINTDINDQIDNYEVKESAQYYSKLSANNGYPLIPALRYYTKLYFGDFDEDGNPEIISWHKGFLSRSLEDSTLGFKLEEEEWSHYERNTELQSSNRNGITGEYLPQLTSPDDIRDWLATNDLTWRKGYPSLSECVGEKGLLIPELHDSNLNDPEVLQ